MAVQLAALKSTKSPILGVSYKTLVTKIKEAGIEQRRAVLWERCRSAPLFD